MSKSILIYGENWTGTLPRLLYEELNVRGYNTSHFDFTDILPGIKNRSLKQRIQRKLFHYKYVMKIRKELLKTVNSKKLDFILIAKGFHLNQATLETIQNKKIVLVNWNPDDFFNMNNSSESLISTMSCYDLIVSSREHLFTKYQQHGVRNLLFLDWYYVPSLHFDHRLNKDIFISFVGSWSPSRESFISCISKPLQIWGGGWEKSSIAFQKKHRVHSKILNQIEMSQVFNRSHFNLNLLTHENDDLTNLRFFEVPASAGLLLTERNEHGSRLLEEGKECLMFDSVDEVNQLLTSERDDFNEIAIAGHQRIISDNHSFSSRVDQLLHQLK